MLTKIEILKEYAKCLDSPSYAIENYLETFDKTQEGFVPFKLFTKQKEIIRAYEKHRFNLVTKPRQAGISTTTQAYCAVRCAFADYKNPETIIVVANKLNLAKKFAKGIKDYVLQLPKWVWGDEFYGTEEKEKKNIFVRESQIEIELPNGSKIVAVATSEDALRGYTPTLLIFDEAAFIDNGASLYGAAVTSLGTGGGAILISTPNGYDPLYYKTYEQSLQGLNNYNVIELKWYQDPRYNKDLRWIKNDDIVLEYEFTLQSFEKMIKDGYKPISTWYVDMCKTMNNDKKRIAQELDTSFLGSGGNVIDDEFINFHDLNNVQKPKFIDETYYDGNSGMIWIWEEPTEGHQYIMGCLPPDEKVLTDKGLQNIQDISLTDKLVSENGEYVNIINKQIYPVINEDIFEITVDNTFRTTTFTKEHPLLISKPILKLDENNLNEEYWDFDFKYEKTSNVEVGDWIKVPNIYNKKIDGILNNKWVINEAIKCDFKIDSPLNNPEFWWFIGIWLSNGSLGETHSISICFENNYEYYTNKINNIISKLFGEPSSFISKNKNTFELVFNSEFLYHYILENFGQNSFNKKISEWVKFMSNEFKIELLKGYLTNNSSCSKTEKNNKINLISVNLELLESIQDIIFSLGIISSLDKIKETNEFYTLSLSSYDSLEFIKLLNNDTLDPKLNNFNLNHFINNKGDDIKSCHFSKNKDFIYFKINNINKSKFTGNVYNFECDTHTFMCHHITTHNCDVARGDGADFSAFQIIDFTTMEQVVEYQGKMQPDLFAELLNKYGLMYKAYLVIDNIGVGNTTVSKILELKYPNLHYDEKSENSKVAGFNINGVRLNLISNLEISIRNNNIKIRSKRIINEMKTFIYKNGKPDHMDGYNDDCLMSLGMALWILETSFKKLEKLEKKTKAMLSSWVGGGSNPKVELEENKLNNLTNKKTPITKPKFNPVVSKNMQDPTGQYMWLFSGKK
jgi:hypothetical protein